jgi:hypothetical protein
MDELERIQKRAVSIILVIIVGTNFFNIYLFIAEL